MFVSFRSLRQPHHSNLSARGVGVFGPMDVSFSIYRFWMVGVLPRKAKPEEKQRKGRKGSPSELFPFLALSLVVVLWCEGRLRSLVPALMDSH